MKKIVVDTDVILDHVLTTAQEGSTLRALARTVFCYTTVFHAAEAFGICRTKAERTAVEQAMRALKVLGVNAKSAKHIGPLLASAGKRPAVPILGAAVCVESRLPLVTGRPNLYRGVRGLKLIPADRPLVFLGKD